MKHSKWLILIAVLFWAGFAYAVGLFMVHKATAKADIEAAVMVDAMAVLTTSAYDAEAVAAERISGLEVKLALLRSVVDALRNTVTERDAEIITLRAADEASFDVKVEAVVEAVAATERAVVDDKARRVALDRKLEELSRIAARMRMCSAAIRKAEARLRYAQNNRGIYKTVKTRHRCRKCGGDGKITTRGESHIATKRCKNCGGDGTYETSSKKRTGTRSTSGEEATVKRLKETYAELKQAYTAKQAEADALKEKP